MDVLLWVVGVLTADYLLGCWVLAVIDDERQTLFHWARSAPRLWMYSVAVLLWPVVWWAWNRRKKECSPMSDSW